ncbi:regulator of nonsense transcripts UPF3-like isoform X6 [Triticum dicoccoides]|uniref:regulator of nonsense transcripts UPF3-like isoform X6 n=1 Tax=Triticum dicoccoides TaxID=85692 RepID=UPI00188E7C07|nr:regulator of nonsense transcripts UPF3-like isoform X6 [Triticum dicoccoides]
MKDPAHRTKVVLRRLPPAIAQQAVVDQVDARFAGRYDWACFRPGNASQKNHRYSRLYLNFKSPEDVVEFAEFFNGHVFVNEKGAQFKALVEYAPSQQVPKSNIKKDARQGTITKDPEYLEFLELISKPTEHLPSAEIQLERKEAERAAAGKVPPVVTPLMVYVRQQRAAKSMAQRSVSSRLSRKVAGVVTSSSSPSKRSSERRRASTSTDRREQQYVVRDNAKEKPTYILAPKRDDHTHREKIIAGTSDATSGGPSGSAQVIDGKKDKIVLLKGRARVDSNSLPPSRNTPPSTSRQDQRNEASVRIIKTILSNKEGRHAIASSQHEQEGHIISAEKDKRPPRAPNSRSTVKDQTVENAEKNHYDDKHLHGSGPIGEKIERHARNRDRPDRGVWAPRRYDKSASGGSTQASSSEFPLMQSHSMDNFSQQVDGHGERKIDTRSPGGRGGLVENGNRHANRRGPPRGSKEMEIPLITSDGKPSKRGPASYVAHERQVWVQKSSSGS